jgi:hypothetical protein
MAQSKGAPPIGFECPVLAISRLFGEAKHILSLVRLRLRGLTGARDEFLMAATVQNLKRLAQHSTIPPPLPSTA